MPSRRHSFPETLEEAEEARRRLAFEELFLHQVALAARRSRRRALDVGDPAPRDGGADDRVARFPALRAHRVTSVGPSAIWKRISPPRGRCSACWMGEVGSGDGPRLYAMLRAVERGIRRL
jgi:RecG-like helicase